MRGSRARVVAALAAAAVAIPAAMAVTTAGATGGTKISTRSTNLGLIVVGTSHRTVYLFTKDTRNRSHCGSTCRQTWIPVRSSGAPVAGPGIRQRKLGRTPKHQVTYYGHPLYYYAGDHRTAGRTTGQGRHAFGGRWWVVSPAGTAGKGTTLTVHSTGDGNAVAGPLQHGRTVYMLASDTRTHSTCTSGCAGVWPPLITTGKPHAGTGIDASLLTTLVRNNGTRQVVYAGHPLYYYSGDSQPGQDYGQCQTTPANWYILKGNGTPDKTGCTAQPAASCGGAPASTPAAMIGTASKTVGAYSGRTIAVDGRGCTVYRYNADAQGGPPTCTVGCAGTWPPVLTTTMPMKGSGLTCTLGEVPNGTSEQVTCDGYPLYFYTGDASTTDVNGEGVGGFYAVAPDGSEA